LPGDRIRSAALYLRHYRYYYDPPEFQTVITTTDTSTFPHPVFTVADPDDFRPDSDTTFQLIQIQPYKIFLFQLHIKKFLHINGYNPYFWNEKNNKYLNVRTPKNFVYRYYKCYPVSILICPFCCLGLGPIFLQSIIMFAVI
jgi:hypothetical protein